MRDTGINLTPGKRERRWAMAVDLNEMYDRLESEYHDTPTSWSRELWELQYETYISPDSCRFETILEKSIAMLARRGHMPGYYNQCPTVSGLFGQYKCKKSAIDLVHWSKLGSRARLIELKWLRRPSSQRLVDKRWTRSCATVFFTYFAGLIGMNCPCAIAH